MHRFVDSSTLICFSKPNRSLDSDEIQRIYNEKNNHIQIHLFVRKNKNDITSKNSIIWDKFMLLTNP